MRSFVLLLAVGCCLLAASAASAARSAPPIKLTGTVGPGFTITLKEGTKVVKQLSGGIAYTLTINDKSSIHNFHLTGPGVNKKTSVGGTGQTKWSITLRKGKYHYQCDPHASSMKGNFTVA